MTEHRQGHDYAAANKQYFDQNVTVFERPDMVLLTRRLATATKEKYPNLFNVESTTVLDYACGAGLFSRELSPYVKSIIAVDISPKAVEQYNSLAAEHGLSDKLRAVIAELKTDTKLDAPIQQFDIVLCSMAYHHFGTPEETSRVLASFVKPGGSLFVIDILSDGTGRDLVHGDELDDVVPHKGGFDEARMKAMFSGAGLTDFEMGVLVPDLVVRGNNFSTFLARGVKPL